MRTLTPTLSPAAPDEPWLVLIDLQVGFADPVRSPWGLQFFPDILPSVKWLIETHAPRVVVTRFVPPLGDEKPEGAWVDYYERNNFALLESNRDLWDLVPEVAGWIKELVPDAPVVDAPTFSKWNADLQAAVKGSRSLVMAGVSTDCCVLMTALAAADAGCHVRVVAEGCAASNPVTQANALAILDGYAPLISVTNKEKDLTKE